MSARSKYCCTFVVGIIVVVGCSRGPSRVNAPAISASKAGSQAIQQFDTDGDGKISGAELEKCPALKAALAQIDTTDDKSLTADEITARINAWQESKLGRISVSCRVLRNGRPLPDAQVELVPEKFLGDNLQTAVGKTDPSGLAVVSIPTSGPKDPPGVAPGLYRIEITKAGENIPAKYNANTILGQEVAKDAKGIDRAIKCDLTY